MTKPEEEKDEAIEKEVSVILDEVEAIINDPSETIERKKQAQTMIQRAIEKGSSTVSGGKSKIGEDLRKRYQYITRMYYNEQIQKLEVIKETLKRQIEQEQNSSFTSPKRLDELRKDLKECEKTIESHKKILERLQPE
jgi:signal transduction protein with GAF and PtsI domain